MVRRQMRFAWKEKGDRKSKDATLRAHITNDATELIDDCVGGPAKPYPILINLEAKVRKKGKEG
jgi:hypothetical protein